MSCGAFRFSSLLASRAAAVAVLAVFVGAGCGGAVRGERAGEQVMYAEGARIRGFDPVKAGDVSSAVAISKIYEGLLQYSYLARPYKVEPCLAESLPEISDDGLTYTFSLRRGIFYQDDPCFKTTGGKGRELEAEDFVYSIKRLADVKNEATGWWAFEGRIAGLDEFRRDSAGEGATDYSRPVEGLRAPERFKLVIRLKEPYPQLLWILTMQYAFAVPREAVEFYGEEFLNHPVGSGPYVLANWRRDYRIEFTRSPKWAETGRIERYPSDGAPGDEEAGLLADAGTSLPIIDRIINFEISDPTTHWLKFVSGDLESSGISRDNWDAVVTKDFGLNERLKGMKIRLVTAPTLDVYYLGFNMADPVVGSNKKLRHALTCAFDSEKWIKFYNGRIVRAKGPIPPGVAGYDDKPSPYPFDIERAARLLGEAGYPGGISSDTGERLRLKIEVGSAADPDIRESMDLISSFMMKNGVIVEPQYNNWPTFLAKIERRQCQMFRLGWVADYPDAQNFLQLFYGPNSSPNPNHSNYANPEFDALYEKIRVMSDTPERTELYKKMADLVIEDCPWIFMQHPMAYGLHHHWVRNHKPHDFPYGMEKYRRIDVEERRKWKETSGE